MLRSSVSKLRGCGVLGRGFASSILYRLLYCIMHIAVSIAPCEGFKT